MKRRQKAATVVATAIASIVGISACASSERTESAVSSAEQTSAEALEKVTAQVIQASVPTHSAWGKSGNWKQRITIRTNDGRQLEGSISLSTRSACVSTGDVGEVHLAGSPRTIKSFQTSN